MKTMWNGQKNVQVPPKVAEFLEDYRRICERHGLALSHEDYQGAFMIERFSPDLIEWAESATLGNIE